MNVRNPLIYLSIGLGLWSCELEQANFNAKYLPYTQHFQEATGYNLLEPSETYILPETLTEISGLTALNDSVLACVEDESGVIFLYSLTKDKMVDQLRFAGPGDYEGIELADNAIYALKSNGNLYQYSLVDGSTNTIKTPLKRSNNSEGLAFDKKNNRLLIALKGEAGLEGTKIRGKAIYAYHLSEGFIEQPIWIITPEELVRWNQNQPASLKITNKRLGFMPSAMAVHPHNNDIYIVATVGKMLLVLSADGRIKHCIPISPRVFRQPEGICFTSNGDLIIASEGQDGNGKIQLFKKAPLETTE